MSELIRTVRLTPYRKGLGPSFTLRMYDTGRQNHQGRTVIAYDLRQHEHGRTVTLFEGTDFCVSPLYADDSDQSVAALLGFLTLRPGDTDAEYFAAYTAEQLAYCSAHAEPLAGEVLSRFGED